LTNEVLTNAYKHAFPNGASGEVAVDFRCGPENTMILQITDSGVGMHSGSSQGLGLKLIHIFVAQLQGTLAIGLAGTAGTAVTLTIQRHAKKRQEHSQVSAR
jgi:two-component sensor histidine kinase